MEGTRRSSLPFNLFLESRCSEFCSEKTQNGLGVFTILQIKRC
jgi:hypothetical protein